MKDRTVYKDGDLIKKDNGEIWMCTHQEASRDRTAEFVKRIKGRHKGSSACEIIWSLSTLGNESTFDWQVLASEGEKRWHKECVGGLFWLACSAIDIARRDGPRKLELWALMQQRNRLWLALYILSSLLGIAVIVAIIGWTR